MPPRGSSFRTRLVLYAELPSEWGSPQLLPRVPAPGGLPRQVLDVGALTRKRLPDRSDSTGRPDLSSPSCQIEIELTLASKACVIPRWVRVSLLTGSLSLGSTPNFW